MGIKNLNWMNNSYNKTNNTGGNNNTGGGGNIDTSNFVKKQEFYASQNEQNDKIQQNLNEITELKNDFNSIDFSKYATMNDLINTRSNLSNKIMENRIEIDSNQSLINDVHNQLTIQNQTNNHYFNEIDKKIENNTTEIEKLKQNGGGNNIDTSNLAKLDVTNKFTKPIFVDYTSDHNYLSLTERHVHNVDSGIKFDLGTPLLYYFYDPSEFIETRIDTPEIIINKGFLDKKLAEKQNKLIAGSGIEITNNTISLSAALQPPPDLSNYYTIEQWDNLYQGMEMTSSAPIITQFNKKALMVFEISTDNIKLQDFIGNLPSEIASWRNIASVESATVNAINVDGDILSKQLDLLISHYNGRLFIKSYGDLPADVKKIRFRIWVNKK